MPQQLVNVGLDELVKFTHELEKIHRSAIHEDVRQTLNSAADNMKKETMPDEYNKTFTVRNKSFLRSRSGFKLASGFEVSGMESISGIIDKSDQATQDLAIQETGGVIGGRSLIPVDTARVGKSKSKQVRRGFRLSNISAHQKVRAGDQQGLLIAANRIGVGGELIYGHTLFQVQKIIRVGSGAKKGNTFVKMLPLYDYVEGRSVSISKRPFVKPAAIKEGKKLNQYFIEHAKKRIKKS